MRRQPLNQAFTLIELLVVISIIALLIGILLPALGAARSTARSIACQSNLRQLAIAANTYATDENGFLPMAESEDVGGAPSYFEERWWGWSVLPYIAGSLNGPHPATLPNAEQAARVQELIEDFVESESNTVFTCPEGGGDWEGYQQQTLLSIRFPPSPTVDFQYFGVTKDQTTLFRGEFGKAVASTVRVDRGRVDQLALHYDGAGGWSNGTPWGTLHGNGWEDAIAKTQNSPNGGIMRHGGETTINFSAVGGNVKAVKFDTKMTTQKFEDWDWEDANVNWIDDPDYAP